MDRLLFGHLVFLGFFLDFFFFFLPFGPLHSLSHILGTFICISAFDNFGSGLIGRGKKKTCLPALFNHPVFRMNWNSMELGKGKTLRCCPPATF